VRHWNFAFQKGFTEAGWQGAWRSGRENPEQCPPGRHPGKRPLHHTYKQIALIELPHHEGRERPVSPKVSTEQYSTGLDPPDAQNILKEPGWHMHDGDRITRQRQRRG
jgi:hypothetical protein